mmetsp:Transcript_21596/g.69731  ORF Transcript_21596/g.69731 Transcript_21596/m.69731 type:complete len:268 (+) Transcript_21596:415-1218(+)
MPPPATRTTSRWRCSATCRSSIWSCCSRISRCKCRRSSAPSSSPSRRWARWLAGRSCTMRRCPRPDCSPCTPLPRWPHAPPSGGGRPSSCTSSCWSRTSPALGWARRTGRCCTCCKWPRPSRPSGPCWRCTRWPRCGCAHTAAPRRCRRRTWARAGGRSWSTGLSWLLLGFGCTLRTRARASTCCDLGWLWSMPQVCGRPPAMPMATPPRRRAARCACDCDRWTRRSASPQSTGSQSQTAHLPRPRPGRPSACGRATRKSRRRGGSS